MGAPRDALTSHLRLDVRASGIVFLRSKADTIEDTDDAAEGRVARAGIKRRRADRHAGGG
jgi:hypothetical protein